MTVGIYAVDNNNQAKVAMRQEINALCKNYDGVVNTHGYFIDLDEKIVSFDVGVDFTILDHDTFGERIKNEVEAKYVGFTAYVNLDSYYSD